jgi:hypothetical protein
VAMADSQKGRPRAGTRSRLMIKVLVGGGLDVSLAIPGRGSNHAGGHRRKIAEYALEDCERTLRRCLLQLLTGTTAPVAASRDDSEGKSFFLNIKGPELLNEYVGETERLIRLPGGRRRPGIQPETPDHQHLRRAARLPGEVPPPAHDDRLTFPTCHDSTRV